MACVRRGVASRGGETATAHCIWRHRHWVWHRFARVNSIFRSSRHLFVDRGILRVASEAMRGAKDASHVCSVARYVAYDANYCAMSATCDVRKVPRVAPGAGHVAPDAGHVAPDARFRTRPRPPPPPPAPRAAPLPRTDRRASRSAARTPRRSGSTVVSVPVTDCPSYAQYAGIPNTRASAYGLSAFHSVAPTTAPVADRTRRMRR